MLIIVSARSCATWMQRSQPGFSVKENKYRPWSASFSSGVGCGVLLLTLLIDLGASRIHGLVVAVVLGFPLRLLFRREVPSPIRRFVRWRPASSAVCRLPVVPHCVLPL